MFGLGEIPGPGQRVLIQRWVTDFFASPYACTSLKALRGRGCLLFFFSGAVSNLGAGISLARCHRPPGSLQLALRCFATRSGQGEPGLDVMGGLPSSLLLMGCPKYAASFPWVWGGPGGLDQDQGSPPPPGGEAHEGFCWWGAEYFWCFLFFLLFFRN